MENGSFPRFIQSEQYKVLVQVQAGLGRKLKKNINVMCVGDLRGSEAFTHRITGTMMVPSPPSKLQHIGSTLDLKDYK